MPIVIAHIAAGRPPEAKRAFMRAVAEAAVATLAVAPEAVRVLVNEVEPDLWGIGYQTKAERDGAGR